MNRFARLLALLLAPFAFGGCATVRPAASCFCAPVVDAGSFMTGVDMLRVDPGFVTSPRIP